MHFYHKLTWFPWVHERFYSFKVGTRHNLWTTSQNGVPQTGTYRYKNMQGKIVPTFVRQPICTGLIDKRGFIRTRVGQVYSTNKRERNTIEVYADLQYSTSSHTSLKQNRFPLTRHDSSPANTAVMPRASSGEFIPKQSTTLSRTDMLRLCNSVTRQVERSQEARNAKRQLNSSHFSNSLERSRLRDRFSLKVDIFLSGTTQFCFLMQALKSLREGEFQCPLSP